MRAVLDLFATRDPRHGPLPLLLMLLTTVTGLVDAVSYLALNHVFVANMTGNVVFLGFAVVDQLLVRHDRRGIASFALPLECPSP